MSSYRVVIEASAGRELSKLPFDSAKRLDNKMQSLSGNPRPPGCLKLAGLEVWRIRVGRFRILYEIDDGLKTVYITRVDDRSDVYRK